MQVRRVGVLSYAKILSVVMACFGLILGVIYGLIFMIFGAAILAQGGNEAAGGGAVGVVMGLVFMVAAPVFYGVIGFVGGVIGALIYNAAAGFVGGIEIELESAERTYAAPSPQQWSAPPPQPGQAPPQYPY